MIENQKLGKFMHLNRIRKMVDLERLVAIYDTIHTIRRPL